MLSKLSRRRGLQLEALGSVLIYRHAGRPLSVYSAGRVRLICSDRLRIVFNCWHTRGKARR